jgi:hypothetical protein
MLGLPAGFTAGALTTDVNPQRLLGATFQPSDGEIPPATDLLFLVNPEGTLIPVTTSRTPDPQPGDTLILLGPSGKTSQ